MIPTVGLVTYIKDRLAVSFTCLYLRARRASGYCCRACKAPFVPEQIVAVVSSGCPECGATRLEVTR